MNYNTIIRFCNNTLVQRLPIVTGNLKMNTKGYSYLIHRKGGVVGKITLNTPYADYVNYGFEKHPNSKKLSRDYKIVENTIKQCLRVSIKGANVK